MRSSMVAKSIKSEERVEELPADKEDETCERRIADRPNESPESSVIDLDMKISVEGKHDLLDGRVWYV